MYGERHTANPHCLTVEMGTQLGVFPADCPYVRDLPDYVPPRMALTPAELEACSDAILDAHDAVRELAPREGESGPTTGGSDRGDGAGLHTASGADPVIEDTKPPEDQSRRDGRT